MAAFSQKDRQTSANEIMGDGGNGTISLGTKGRHDVRALV